MSHILHSLWLHENHRLADLPVTIWDLCALQHLPRSLSRVQRLVLSQTQIHKPVLEQKLLVNTSASEEEEASQRVDQIGVAGRGEKGGKRLRPRLRRRLRLTPTPARAELRGKSFSRAQL